jgi:hypothetical protein
MNFIEILWYSRFVISKFTHIGTTQEDEGSISTMFFQNNINSNCNWLYDGRRRINLFCFHLKNIINEGFDLQSYKIQICTWYFEMFVTICIVGSNINPSCNFFYKINVCLIYVHWSGVEACFIYIYKWFTSSRLLAYYHCTRCWKFH